jgi:hypothetical protein
VGPPAGGAATATIGAAGGSLGAPDGQFVLTIPAGALATDTVVGIQPLANMAHGGIGAAYRLTPDGQTFGKPVTLAFAYTDADLLGTAAAFLGVAFQTAEGHWQKLGGATVDTAAKTVSVASTHFTDVSKVKGLQLRPAEKTIGVGESVELRVKFCYAEPTEDDDLASLGYACDLDQGSGGELIVDQWSVNGQPGGSGGIGTVLGNNAAATYTAPAAVPTPHVVAVSARARIPPFGDAPLVVSNITISSNSYHVRIDEVEYDSGLPCAVARSAEVHDHSEFDLTASAGGLVAGAFVNGTTTFSTPVVDPPATYTVSVVAAPEWHTYTSGTVNEFDGHVFVLLTGTELTGACVSHNGSANDPWDAVTSETGLGFDFDKADFVAGTQTLTPGVNSPYYSYTITIIER